jgi:hypothetical protein
MLVPGQSMPAEGTEGGTSSTTSSTSSHVLSTGAIAGIVVAGVAFVAILVALFFVLGRQRVYNQWISSQDGRNERTARWALFGGQSAQSDPWSRKSELESNAPKATFTDNPFVVSPDPNRHTFSSAPDGSAASMYGPSSPPISSGWTWDAQHKVRANFGPTELEANSLPHQLPGTREYR